MTHIAQQLKTGLYMATQSFSMLWYQKKLLLYLGLLALINITVKLIMTNLSNGAPFFSLFKGIHHHVTMLPLWFAPIETLLVLYGANILTMFFTVALLHHIADSMKNIPTSIKGNFLITLAKIKIIAPWAAVASFFELLASTWIDHASTSELPLIGHLTISALTIAWLVITFFMLPLIAIHTESLGILIKKSALLSKNALFSIFGGECWFGLIILLVSMPFLIIWLLASQPALSPLLPALGLLVAEILVKCWIATAHSIFKMILLKNQEVAE